MREDISVVVSVTEDCDSDCVYCIRGESEESMMDEETVKNLMIKLADIPGIKTINLYWNGGETLLQELGFYELAIDVQKNIGKNIMYDNGLQTNARRLNNEWLDFFQKNDIGVSISLDGPKDIHDRQRPYKPGFNTNSPFDNVIAAAELMKAREMKFGTICVVTQLGLGRADELFDFFRDTTGSVKFRGMESVGKGVQVFDDIGISPIEYAGFLEQIFERWKEDPNFRVDPFISRMKERLTGKVLNCYGRKACSENYLFVMSNGDVSPCGLNGLDEYKYGNINEDSIEKIINSQIKHKLTSLRLSVEACNSCSYYDDCGGGCMESSYSQRGRIDDKDRWCFSNKKVIDLVDNELDTFYRTLKQKEA